jgi:hypothetical protein
MVFVKVFMPVTYWFTLIVNVMVCVASGSSTVPEAFQVMLMYCCPINGTQSPTESESVVGIVPLLITEILADMTEEKQKPKDSTA